ncbi:hypothetical protein AF336_04240 [Bradyrhizobium diazoefficiens]|nr:hypothetical protein BD122_05600 [Bradyrhizobium diazoefficiens]KOY12346.1 hypothetical protein AF336_04240 [Bradyrhizobium diazoefficiens]
MLLQINQARMPVLADDDVAVHGGAEHCGDIQMTKAIIDIGFDFLLRRRFFRCFAIWRHCQSVSGTYDAPNIDAG